MNNILTRAFIAINLLLCFVFSTSFCDSPYKKELNKVLYQIKSTLEVSYAPSEWKSSYLGWEINEAYQKIQEITNKNDLTSLRDTQRLVKKFLDSSKDYHVGAMFYSTEFSFLPFAAKGVDGRYFIVAINRDLCSEKDYPFELGDELVAFDGQSPHDVVQKILSEETRLTGLETDDSLAQLYLTNRMGASGHQVPKGNLMITVKSHKTGELKDYPLTWLYYPEEILDPKPKALVDLEDPVKKSLDHLCNKKFLPAFYSDFEKISDICLDNPYSVGAKKSFIPLLGTPVWKTSDENPFYAYMFKLKDGRICGYVRIPSFVGDHKMSANFGRIIKVFEQRSNLLVIDLVNNPGGNLFYLYSLLSMLTDYPLQLPKHKVSLTQADIFDAILVSKILDQVRTEEDTKKILGESLFGYPVSLELSRQFTNYFRFIIKEWNEGRIVTSLSDLMGIKEIKPNETVHYTKPILVLINELDFSCGDFFPAVMQDNSRATLMGCRTAGAGGYVLTFSFPNRLGLAHISYTGSLAIRPNGQPIENLGIEPDIHFKFEPNDFKKGHQRFRKQILETLGELHL